MKIHPVGTKMFRADGRTADRQKDANSHLMQFSNAPKNLTKFAKRFIVYGELIYL